MPQIPPGEPLIPTPSPTLRNILRSNLDATIAHGAPLELAFAVLVAEVDAWVRCVGFVGCVDFVGGVAFG
jgi:hypothetical protein